ncbi:hypothetical protein KAFR_0D03880 [Kazachstania africana CBS 2517]|uniref:Essential protein Yae1 N-terminal domain-containing protein n=1 Tax=Kazachstania africana (strain ATCC 22294 / BCRC 22015 / CBS 2517 / CECT 1963 / NBRC 1671 / NRRL Y-8276) TaxID=1071382 RepID=H2AUI6_KAZAF|nr:hypothetical protein KAFR_0D03880 [Kazachstania africana CBS 2517]CCF58036.1 hypothetical protein KAFR_0D03880 [Kazachstania africana CBS 2517]
MSAMDFDELLNLEEQYYQEGFKEGQEQNLENNFLEGKQFGLQVGFQRFVLLGHMLGLCDFLESLNMASTNLTKNIATIRELIEGIDMSNDEEEVENLEKTIVKLKNKFRTILLLFQRQMKQAKKKPLTFDDIEDLSRVIGGEIKGFVEDEETTDAKTAQDQAQDW